MESYKIGKEIVRIESLITKRKEQIIEKDDEFMRWKARSEALKDRI